MSRLYLKKSREDALNRRHPWIFSGAVERVEGQLQTGATISVCNTSGTALAVGAYSPESQIRVRIWDFDPQAVIDKAFFTRRLQAAIAARNKQEPNSNAQRLVYAEADGLPGLVVDRYADVLVCQFLSAGAEYHKALIVEVLQELLDCEFVYERSDVSVREKEGLSPSAGLLAGREPDELLRIHENGLHYLVDIRQGHKTGFYLDQRDNRAFLSSCSQGTEVLNCFAYTGGFGLAALAGGANSVTNLDTSAPALQLAERNAQENGFAADRFVTIEADVFARLRQMQSENRSFDIIVLDPPKFIDNKKQLDRGARAYKDINLQALKLLRPGGLLFSFSCSGLMQVPLFQKIIADAALDAKCTGHIVRQLGQAEDHPISLNFPEAAYLKGFCIRKREAGHGY